MVTKFFVKLQIRCLESALRTCRMRLELAEAYQDRESIPVRRDQIRFYETRIDHLRSCVA